MSYSTLVTKAWWRQSGHKAVCVGSARRLRRTTSGNSRRLASPPGHVRRLGHLGHLGHAGRHAGSALQWPRSGAPAPSSSSTRRLVPRWEDPLYSGAWSTSPVSALMAMSG